MANQQGNFALTPALAQPDWIDYSTRTGMDIFKAATAPLSEPFDGQAENLRAFLDKVRDRAAAFGWNNVIMVMTVPGIPAAGLAPAVQPVFRSLVVEYGMITLPMVVAHAAAYNGQ